MEHLATAQDIRRLYNPGMEPLEVVDCDTNIRTVAMPDYDEELLHCRECAQHDTQELLNLLVEFK